MATKLTTITDIAELKALQELYRRDWPKQCVGYFWLDNFLRWLTKKPLVKYLKIYTLNGDWQSDGLFILLHRYQLFFCNLSRSKTPELITSLNLMDQRVGYKVSAIHETHYSIYKELIVEKQLSVQREMKTNIYSLRCDKARQVKINCPLGYKLNELQWRHAVLINELWPARHAGSLKLIELLIENNLNMGLYDGQTGALCAWCLRLQSGFLGALQVLATHQRQGLGSVVVAALAKRIAQELQQDVTALVSCGNSAANKLFSNLAFTLLNGEHYYWSICLPKEETALVWTEQE